MNRLTVLLFLGALCVLGLISYQLTHAFFSSAAHSTNNVFAAATVFPTATPTPTPTVAPGDVVINELNWEGSSFGTADEWIELRNTTNHSINISNWQITKWSTTPSAQEELMVTIPSSNTIPAGGFFLIARKSPGSGSELTVTPDDIDSSVSLNNSNLQVKLYVNNWNTGGLLIDAAGNKGTPLAGVDQGGNNKEFFSMERNSSPGDGTQASNWHTASTSVNINADSGQNKATPKAAND